MAERMDERKVDLLDQKLVEKMEDLKAGWME
jgi:hypothetical protein